jgi:large subunit ribosomal protein L24
MVIAGNEKGRQGRVLSINKKRDRAIVEGLNMIKKHQKPTSENPQGGIHETESGIHVSNLMVIDSKGNPTRVRRSTEANAKGEERISVKSNTAIK